MDISSIIILSLIVSAFVLFASVLMYGEYATRQAQRIQADKAAQAESQRAPLAKERHAA